MADSSGTNGTPDTIDTADSQKEVLANNFMNAASPAILYGNRSDTTVGLTWGFYGGDLEVDGVITAIGNNTVLLTASQTNYVEANRAGTTSVNTTGYTPGRIPLYRVVTGVSSITSYNDDRAPWRPSYIVHEVTFAVTTADVTLTAAQARGRRLTTTGTLTGNRNVIVPDSGEWIVFNNCGGAFTLTVKTSGGSGIVVGAAKHAILYADGTNVVRVTADA
jgi:hypothetical protein